MKRSFTLLEIMLVIAIIAVLTGLAIPAAVLARQKGRITTAKADMHAIQIAFKALENTYGKMVNKSGSNVTFNGQSASVTTGTYEYVRINGTDTATPVNHTLYNNVIVELSDPSRVSSASNLNVNKRRLTVLEPKSEYDTTVTVSTNSVAGNKNAASLWYDPWGKPYVILINTNHTNAIPDPANSSRTIGGSIHLYSCGPDGDNNQGNGDDICTWK